MPKLGDAVGLSAIFQPLLPLPVHAHLKNNETFILPSQGCFNGVFLLLNKNADPECSGCSSVRSCRSEVAANTCCRSTGGTSIWFRGRGQGLGTEQKGVVENSSP